MKNIFLGLIFTMFFLPQVSFGQTTPVGKNTPPAGTNPAPVVTHPSFTPPPVVVAPGSTLQAACTQQQTVATNDFFQRQANERAAFGQTNPNAMTAHDKHFQAMLAKSMLDRVHKDSSGIPVPDDDNSFAAFQAKQLSDKQHWFARSARELQICLSGTTTTTTTP